VVCCQSSGDSDAAAAAGAGDWWSVTMPPQRSSSSSMSSTFDEDVVHQLRTNNCAKLIALVNMHLSFVLDLSFLSELIDDPIPPPSSSATADNTDKPSTIVSVFAKKKQTKGDLLIVSNELIVQLLYC